MWDPSLYLGLLLLAVVSVDFLFTTIGAEEKTILSFRVTRAVFHALRRAMPAAPQRWLHRISGPVVMTALAAFWVLGVSFGWALVFAAFPEAVDSRPGVPAPGWWDVYAHVGHLLSTLGAGLTEPASSLWYVIGVFVAVNGMVILTLSVSFILSTTQTVVQGRAFAVLSATVDPRDPAAFQQLAPQLSQLCSSLKSAPFALFYSSESPELRLPHALYRFAERAADGPDFARYRGVLELLPTFEPPAGCGAAAFLARLDEWRRAYSLDG